MNASRSSFEHGLRNSAFCNHIVVLRGVSEGNKFDITAKEGRNREPTKATSRVGFHRISTDEQRHFVVA